MRHRLVLAAIAATVLLTAACASERVLGPPMRYTTITSLEMMNPTTHRLEAVAVPPRSTAPGVTATVTAGSSPPVTMAFNAPGLSTHGGSRAFGFTTPDGKAAKIVFLYGANGGPPATIQSYRDHALVSTDAYTWTSTATGWMAATSVLTLVKNGALVGRVTTTTVPCHTNCGPPQAVMQSHHLVGSLLYALADVTSTRAAAQWYNMHFNACAEEWRNYAAALAAEAAAVGMAETVWGSVAAAALVVAVESTERALVMCMASQPEAGDSAQGGQGSGSGGGATPTSDCLAGSYAAQCTTPFTL